jgi:alpha-1,3-rhamnosyltransferase
MKVTIIICSFNQDFFLKKCIESAIYQTYKNLEIILIDNGSNDNSKKICEYYKKSFLNIKYLNYKKNESVSQRLNFAIKIAKGKFISFLFGDDQLVKSKISHQIKLFKKLDDKYGVVYGPVNIIDIVNKTNVKRNVVKINGLGIEGLLNFSMLDGHIDLISPLFIKKVLIENNFLNNIFLETEMIFFCYGLKYNFFYHPKIVAKLTNHSNNYGKRLYTNVESSEKRLKFLFKKKFFKKKYQNKMNNYMTFFYRNVAWENLRNNGNKLMTIRYLKKHFMHSNLLNLLNFKNFALYILIFFPQKIIKILNNLYSKIN